MYTKQQASQARHEFWTTFGQYMAPVLSSEGEKINWINYKTGQKHVFIKMDADQKFASIGFEISHPALDVQKHYYDHFLQLKKTLHATLNEDWDWVLHTTNTDGKVISRIFTEIAGINLFNKEDWPRLISFFKPRLIALDTFWNNVKYGFDMLS